LNGELEAAWGVRLAQRTGVNTGEVVVGDTVHGREIVVGDAVNVAARLEQAAGPGEVLIGEQTRRLVRDAATVEPVAPLAVKGKGAPVGAFRLVGVRPDVLGHARHLEAPMVGRSVELGLLATALGTAVAESACHLALVLGPAGVGKSRLVQQFLATVEGQGTVLRGRCVEYGEGLTYWPIAEVIRQAAVASGEFGLRDLLEGEEHAAFVAEGLAGMAGTAGQTASREEVPWAVADRLKPQGLAAVAGGELDCGSLGAGCGDAGDERPLAAVVEEARTAQGRYDREVSTGPPNHR
jgi:hypothetical protein